MKIDLEALKNHFYYQDDINQNIFSNKEIVNSVI